jgi:tetratricopeptide (TPR) repeat protein
MKYHLSLLDYFCQRDRGWTLSLFGLVCLIYLPFLGNPLVFDDVPFFTMETLEHYAHASFQFDLRWLPYASFGWTYAVFSDVLPHFFRLGNVLLHAINVILLFYLLRLLFTAAIATHKNFSAIVWGSWLGALIFAVHPVAVYAVGYLVERSILMATLFSLVMQLAYVQGLLTGKKRWLLVSVVAYFLAVYSKEQSVMSLAVLAAMTIAYRNKIVTATRALWLAWCAYIVVALFVVMSSKGVIGQPYEAMASSMFKQQGINVSASMLHALSAMTQMELFFKYLMLWLLPNPAWLSIDMREPFVATLTAWQGWLGVVGFVAYGAFAIWMLFRSGWQSLAGLALIYPWIQFVVEFSTIRVQEPFVLYRSYLWMPGLALFIPLLLAKFPNRKTLLSLSCIVLLLIPLSWNRLWIFGDNYRLWNDAALLLPNQQVAGADRIFYNRGVAQMSAHKWNEAVEDLQRVVKISPELAPVHKVLGDAYLNSTKFEAAIMQYDASISMQQNNPEAYLGKGFALKRLHKDEQAMSQMTKACELKNFMACFIAGRLSGK